MGIDEKKNGVGKERVEVWKRGDGILLGGVGGGKWDEKGGEVGGEKGLVWIGKEVELFGKMRRVKVFDRLSEG
nr:isocitrate/isopropylmalate family dehydrogenase [Bacillus altitudinis]